MSFQLKRGLAEFGYPDHYAVLGVAIDASAGEIRKRYMKLARRLHPDSCESSNKEQASKILSKLVNPAYQMLSQEKERTDYSLLLKLVGQRANLEFGSVKLTAPEAQALLTTPDFETFYQTALETLVEQQYSQPAQFLEKTEKISELNLAFLLCRERSPSSKKYAEPEPAVSAVPINPEAAITTPTRESAVQATAAQQMNMGEGFVSQYLRRAEDYIEKNLYSSATQELRDALRLDPQNVRCHVLMGKVYLKQNQPKMAKGHLTQAIKLDPQNAEARQAMADLQKLEAKVAKATPAEAKASKSGAKVTQPSAKPAGRRGLFGLFGGKK